MNSHTYSHIFTHPMLCFLCFLAKKYRQISHDCDSAIQGIGKTTPVSDNVHLTNEAAGMGQRTLPQRR